jgi:hypothetical protein
MVMLVLTQISGPAHASKKEAASKAKPEKIRVSARHASIVGMIRGEGKW